jgi:hypothetical protein
MLFNVDFVFGFWFFWLREIPRLTLTELIRCDMTNRARLYGTTIQRWVFVLLCQPVSYFLFLSLSLSCGMKEETNVDNTKF